MKRDLSVYLDDIVDAMGKAEMFVAGMSYEQSEEDLRSHYLGRCHTGYPSR